MAPAPVRFDPLEPPPLEVMSLAGLARRGAWTLALAHDRPEHLLIWMTRGQGVALLDGALRGIGAHHALFIPSAQLMAVDPDRNALGMALRIPPGSIPALPAEPCHLRILDAGARAELTGLFDSLRREQTGTRAMKRTAAEAYANLIAIWLHRQLVENHPTTATTTAPEPAARHLSRAYCAEVAARYRDQRGVARLAARLGIAPSYLARACRSQTGRTAADLLAERTEHAARKLLTCGTVPVQDIARHLGFSSAASFSRFVRRRTGRSPSALRAADQTGR